MTERRYRTLRRYVVRLNYPAIGALVWLNVIASYRVVAAQVGHDPGQSPYRDVRRGGVLVAAGGYQEGIMYRDYAQALTAQQVNDLVAYMLTLKSGQDN